MGGSFCSQSFEDIALGWWKFWHWREHTILICDVTRNGNKYVLFCSQFEVRNHAIMRRLQSCLRGMNSKSSEEYCTIVCCNNIFSWNTFVNYALNAYFCKIEFL